MSVDAVEIFDRKANAFVQAILYDGLGPEHLIMAAEAWNPYRVEACKRLLETGIPRNQWPQSLHWDWRRKAPQLKLLECTGFGILCKREWQGLMLTKTSEQVTRLGTDAGKPLLYVDFIESAPWNDVRIVDAPLYKGVGTRLFERAVRQSVDEGFHGRVGLHSLPQSESFYERCNMTRIGPDASKHNLAYFEMSQDQAKRFLERR